LCWCDKMNNLVQTASKFAAHTLITQNNSDRTQRGKSPLLSFSMSLLKK
jgi:phosphotransferase system HPr-like phosphotransfer protein